MGKATVFKTLALVSVFIFSFSNLLAQQTVFFWNFDDEAKRDAVVAAEPSDISLYTADAGTGAIDLIGPGFAGWVLGAAGEDNQAPNSSGWNDGLGTKYWLITTSTSNFSDLKLSSLQRGSNTGPRDFKVQYSVDGSNWNDVPGSDITVANNFTSGVLDEVALPAAAEDRGTLYLRWIMMSNTSVNAGTVLSAGTNRIDGIHLTGTLDVDDPFLAVAPTSLSGFIYNEGEGPSGSQSFQVSGMNLEPASGNISVDASGTNFEVSVDNIDFDSSVNLSYSASELSAATVYVRLEAGLDQDSYLNEQIEISGGGAGLINLTVSGEVKEPVLTGDMLVRYPILESGQLEAFAVDNVTATDLTISSGNIFFGSAQSAEWSTPMPYAYGTGGWGQSNPETAKYFSFVITAAEGYVVNINRIEFEERATLAGPSASTIFVNGANAETLDIPANTTRPRNVTINDSFGEIEFRFAGWDNESRTTTGGGEFRVNDFTVYGTVVEEPVSVEIAGNAGWRMLSIPVEGATVADLAAQNQVQGIAGAADLYGTEAPDGIESDPPNIFTSYETGWNAPANVSDVLEIGKGLIWYLFNNDEGVSTPLPFTLTATGARPASDVTTSLHTRTEQLDDGDGGTAQVAFNLLGNPFSADLDIREIGDWVDGGSLNSSIVQVWKNDEAGWQEGLGHQGEWVLIGGGNNDDKVAAWQGFMVENLNATSIEYPASARTDGGTLLKEQQPVQKRLVFTLEGENTEAGLRTRDAANLVFDDQAEKGWDLLDATQLTPLAGSYATLSFVGDVNGQQVLKVQESRPAEFEGRFEIPMAFEAYNMGGDFTISWDGLADLPSEWQLTLTDLHTGQSMNLREADEYTFRYENGNQTRPAKSVGAGAVVSGVKPLVLSADDEQDGGARFRLIVDSEPVSSEIPGDVPQELELSQNYPNPFNPSTVIRYTVPEQAHIRLTVYDMLGREISVLVNEQQGPGSYDVTWDGTDFTSGLYLYRLEAGSKSITRRMTFIK